MSDLPDLQIGDPVMDAAQGRPMLVLDTPTETVTEWSERNDYDLTENYGNSKFNPSESEPAVACVYLSNVGSEPSKDYTFPRSRLRLLDAHHADDGRRVYERVLSDVLERLFVTAHENGDIEGLDLEQGDPLLRLAHQAFGATETVGEAYEMAQAEVLIDGDTGDSNDAE